MDAETTASVSSLASLVVGIITPLLVSVINRPGMNKNQRQLIAIAASVVVGVLTLTVQGVVFDMRWTVEGIITNLVLVIGASQTAYATLWSPTGVAKTVERKTSPPPGD